MTKRIIGSVDIGKDLEVDGNASLQSTTTASLTNSGNITTNTLNSTTSSTGTTTSTSIDNSGLLTSGSLSCAVSTIGNANSVNLANTGTITTSSIDGGDVTFASLVSAFSTQHIETMTIAGGTAQPITLSTTPPDVNRNYRIRVYATGFFDSGAEYIALGTGTTFDLTLVQSSSNNNYNPVITVANTSINLNTNGLTSDLTYTLIVEDSMFRFPDQDMRSLLTEQELSSSVTSTSTTTPANSLAVKTANDRADAAHTALTGKLDTTATAADSLELAGRPASEYVDDDRISDSVTSTSTTNVASSEAVRAANANANGRLTQTVADSRYLNAAATAVDSAQLGGIAAIDYLRKNSRFEQQVVGSLTDRSRAVLLLHQAYDATPIDSNFFEGRIYIEGGDTSSSPVTTSAVITTGASSTQNKGTMILFENSANKLNSQIVICSFNSVKYIALDIRSSDSMFTGSINDIYAVGYYGNTAPEQFTLVPYADINTVSGQPDVTVNSEVAGSITPLTVSNLGELNIAGSALCLNGEELIDTSGLISWNHLKDIPATATTDSYSRTEADARFLGLLAGTTEYTRELTLSGATAINNIGANSLRLRDSTSDQHSFEIETDVTNGGTITYRSSVPSASTNIEVVSNEGTATLKLNRSSAGSELSVDDSPVFTAASPPSKSQVGLGAVDDFSRAHYDSRYVGVTDTAADSLELGGIPAADYITGSDVIDSVTSTDTNAVASSIAVATVNTLATGKLDETQADAFYVRTQSKNTANGVAGLDALGKVASSVLPTITTGSQFIVPTETQMLNLPANIGDLAIRTDFTPPKVFSLTVSPATTLANWSEVTASNIVTTFNGRAGVVDPVLGDYNSGLITHNATTVQAEIARLSTDKADASEVYTAATSDITFLGINDTASNSSLLGGVSLSSFLRSDANDISTGSTTYNRNGEILSLGGTAANGSARWVFLGSGGNGFAMRHNGSNTLSLYHTNNTYTPSNATSGIRLADYTTAGANFLQDLSVQGNSVYHDGNVPPNSGDAVYSKIDADARFYHSDSLPPRVRNLQDSVLTITDVRSTRFTTGNGIVVVTLPTGILGDLVELQVNLATNSGAVKVVFGGIIGDGAWTGTRYAYAVQGTNIVTEVNLGFENGRHVAYIGTPSLPPARVSIVRVRASIGSGSADSYSVGWNITRVNTSLVNPNSTIIPTVQGDWNKLTNKPAGVYSSVNRPTKSDVGLGNVPNFGFSSNTSNTSNTTLATIGAVTSVKAQLDGSTIEDSLIEASLSANQWYSIALGTGTLSGLFTFSAESTDGQSRQFISFAVRRTSGSTNAPQMFVRENHIQGNSVVDVIRIRYPSSSATAELYLDISVNVGTSNANFTQENVNNKWTLRQFVPVPATPSAGLDTTELNVSFGGSSANKRSASAGYYVNSGTTVTQAINSDGEAILARDLVGIPASTIFHNGRLPTATQVGAVPSTGGTFSGNLALTGSNRNLTIGSSGIPTLQFSNRSKFIYRSENDAMQIESPTNTDPNNYIASIGSNACNFRSTIQFNGTEVYHPANKPSARDIGALPTTGGTITGNLSLNNRNITALNSLVFNDIAETSGEGIQWPVSGGSFQLWPNAASDLNVTYGGSTYKVYHEGNRPPISSSITSSSTSTYANSNAVRLANNTAIAAQSTANGRLADGGTYGTVTFTNWVRTSGNTGWFNSTHGGGMTMENSSEVLVSHNKNLRVNGAIRSTGDITAFFSDKRLKSNIKPLEGALDKIKSTSGCSYDIPPWSQDLMGIKQDADIGLIAQEVKDICPEAIALAPFDDDGFGNSKSGGEYLTIKYAKLVPVLWQAIKELSEQVEELKNGN